MKKLATIVGGLLLTVIGGLLVNWLTPVDIVGLSLKAVSGIQSFCCTRVALPFWSLIGIAFVFPVVLWAMRSLPSKGKQAKALPPEMLFLNYCSDSLLGIDWTWAYRGNRIEDRSLTARCPQCKCTLDWVQESGFRIIDFITLICPNCGFRKEFDRNEHDLIRLIHQHIDRKIVTGEFNGGRGGRP